MASSLRKRHDLSVEVRELAERIAEFPHSTMTSSEDAHALISWLQQARANLRRADDICEAWRESDD